LLAGAPSRAMWTLGRCQDDLDAITLLCVAHRCDISDADDDRRHHEERTLRRLLVFLMLAVTVAEGGEALLLEQSLSSLPVMPDPVDAAVDYPWFALWTHSN